MRILLALFPLLTFANTETVRLLHYNIKELDSSKINMNTSQIKDVAKLTAKYSADIISLNEIQFDKINVPTSQYQTEGKNIEKLNKLLSLNFPYSTFAEANTGKNAKTKSDGTYFIAPDSQEARDHADEVNFGTMPGQYSTGALFKYKIVEQKIITDLKWKEFNPKADLSQYKTPTGKDFPEDMKLFDKSFSDITLEIGSKKLHLILLHTVPSYHFGNPRSINDFRNAEQLRFLEWYTTRKTDFSVNLAKINPLEAKDYYLIVGDLNVDINDQSSEGSSVLKRIIKKSNSWIRPDKLTFTNESGNFAPSPMRLLLDYIIVSKNIRVKKGLILHPKFDRDELGCGQKPSVSLPGKTIVSYTKQSKECFVMVDKEYAQFKNASDHYPIYGEFSLE